MKRSCKRILSTVLSLTLLCCMLPAALAAENDLPLLTTTSAPAQSGPLKVLLIGNSLTADAGSYIPDVVEAEGEEIILGVLHKGSSTLQLHMDYALEDSQIYSYYKYEDGEWTLNGAGSYTMFKGLQDEAWDVVFLQQNCTPAADPSTYDVLDELIPHITRFLTNPNVKLGWYMTGPYPFAQEQLFNYSQDGEPAAMHRYTMDAVKAKILTRKDISYITPVGTALVNATTSFVGHTLHRDHIHMNTLGRTIAAYTFYCTLFGKTLDTIKLTDVPESKAALKGYITPARTVTPEEALAVTEAVNNAIKNPLEITPSAYEGKPVIADHSATCPSRDMTDVDKDAWYHEAVDFALENKIMGGYSATTFGPNDTLSRAMVVQILYNKEGQPAVSGAHAFTDAPADQWYNNAIIWGTTHGIMGGYGDGKFGPDDAVTLEQVAVILWNYSGNLPFVGTADSVGPHSSWASNALAWAVESDLLEGIPFDVVTAPATRAQTAQFIMNYLSK
ncbi:MAG: DUF4886 domain-containing protein [Oscillospiraceae bacterium]|nr:DUF4886 domain-containing protein [Oscillospiraceae bacterium]